MIGEGFEITVPLEIRLHLGRGKMRIGLMKIHEGNDLRVLGLKNPSSTWSPRFPTGHSSHPCLRKQGGNPSFRENAYC